MADDKLAKVKVGGDHAPLARRIEPTVISKADPPSEWLLQARADLNRKTSLQGTLLQGKKDGVPNEVLADHLGSQINEGWQGGFAQEAYDAALYLLDEYDQLGQGMHLVSTETGRVLITLTDEDIWEPGMVPREGGGMAKALPRIRPDLEAAITTWTFDRSREQKIVEALASKGHQTALLKEEGDPRLLVATRQGRTQIVQGLVNHTPKKLLVACGGTSGAFLRYFYVQTREPEVEHRPDKSIRFELALEGTLEAFSAMKISDQSTVNLHHNRAGTLRGVIAQGWVRELARRLSRLAFEATEDRLEPVSIEAVKLRKGFWVVPPEAIAPLRGQGSEFLPVDRAHFMGMFAPKVGILVVPEVFGAETNEMFEKWTTSASLDFKLWVDWSVIGCMNVTGLAYQGHVV